LIIGGVAVGLLSVPRFTEDVDAMVLQGDRSMEELIALPAEFGLVHRFADALGNARHKRMLLLTHERTGTQVDVSIGGLPFEEEMLRNARIVQHGRVTIRIPKPEHLILMKAFAGRTRDLLDLHTLSDAFPNFDREWVRMSLAELAELTEQNWLVSQFDEFLLKHDEKQSGQVV
jgi:hypothetical protein